MPESIKILDWELTNESCQSCECSLFEWQSDMETKREHSNPAANVSRKSQSLASHLIPRASEVIWGDVTPSSSGGKWLTVDFYVLTVRRKQDLIWTTSRYKYLQRASPTIAPSPIAMSHCRAMSQQHPVPYSRTLVRRRIKCHFDSFPIWSKFLVDKMQMSAIIWQVIWWCRRYGGYA